MAAPLLEVNNLTKKFGGLYAVNQVSFNIKKGEVVGLIGPNGSGKTTLVLCIMGLYKKNSGTIFFKGKNKLIVFQAPVIAWQELNIKIEN